MFHRAGEADVFRRALNLGVVLQDDAVLDDGHERLVEIRSVFLRQEPA